MSTRISDDEFADLVGQALSSLPAEFDRYLDGVAIDVESMPDRDTARSVGLRSRRHLLGLYVGVPLTQRSIEHTGRLPDRIVIYRENILRICRTRQQVIDQVCKTVLHEVGHHFGLDEVDLDDLGYG